ncbi:lisH domain and HEAT repeat-containing KIAA1468 homolog [Paramuricea clavata]|uniref:LisH domain and HEAT repeat-containing KIAA1468 homolog n=1 Tax=Paramuricea clavata TaxID=317549 RepID=A0A6S7IBC3_PARCT|nr:lisH domain and HEAT repeat-containing KIAA1468 homolog [Paramuricea clavata]
MIIRVDKCSTFGIKKAITKSVQYLPKLLISNQLIPKITIGESFQYLGRYFDFHMSNDNHKTELTTLLNELMSDIDSKPLHPKNKLLLYSRYVLSKLAWHFTVATLSKTWVTENIDSIANKYIRRWLEVPISGTLSTVFLTNNKFGLSIYPPSVKFIQCQTVLRKALKYSPNESTNDLWRATSNHTNIQYDAYNSTKEVLKDFRSGHENKLLNQLTSQGSFFCSVTKFALPQLSKVWSIAQSKLPKNIYNFTIRYINNSLPTRKNLNRWAISSNSDCSFCLSPETLLHIVAGCQFYLDRFTWRHNSVLNFLAHQLQTVDGSTLYADLNGFKSPSILTGDTYRPDLLLSCSNGSLYVVELTTGYETNLKNNVKRKKDKYRELLRQLDMLDSIGLDKNHQMYCDFIHIEKSKADDETELESTMTIISSRLLLYVRALTNSVAALMADVLNRAPFQEECDALERETTLSEDRVDHSDSPLTDMTVLFGGAGRLANFLEYFDKWLEKEETQTFWESLAWVRNKFMSRIYSLLGRIHHAQVDWIDGVSEFFRNMCHVFGHVYTVNRLKPFFENELKCIFEDEQSLSDEEKQQVISSAIIPVFLLGILTSYSKTDDQENVKSFMKDALTSFASQQKDSHSLYLVCEKLSSDEIWCEVLFETLWGLLIHSEPNVRSVVPHLLQTMIKNLDKTSIMKRVLPALVTLSTDNDKSVRISTVPAFGAIVEHISDDEMLEKIHIQFQSFLSDPSYYDQHELQVALIRTFGKIGPHSEPRFRDDFLHPKLTELVMRNAKTEDEAKKTEVAVVLLEAYASLTCCFIPEDILRNNTLPGLMYLKQDLATLAPDYEATVSLLMKDCEDKLVSQKTAGPGPTASKVHAEDVKRAILNKFHKLKEVSPKPKMVDIFRKKNRSDSDKPS